MRKSNKPSFEVKKARTQKICIWCGKQIPKDASYYSKSEHNAFLRETLENEIGFDIYTIKARTKLWYVDVINWPFCSLQCLGKFSACSWDALPFEVRGRMGLKIMTIVKKVKDVVGMMTFLQGGKNHNSEDLPSTC